VLSNAGHDFGKETTAFQSANREEMMLLASLKDLISSGEHRLDAMLAAIASAARRLTGASGSAIAMWKDGVMVCRARSGETAPALGAELNAETGISGECLRTGAVQHCPDTEKNPLVNVEVCRGLGLRSMVVLPIRGWHAINGILEVFGTEPAAFSEHQVALLVQLAALAERARTLQPHGASQVVPKDPDEKHLPPGLLRASDRVRDLALAVVGRRSGRFILGAIGVAAIVLVSLAIWLGWRGANQNDSKAHAAPQSSVAATVTARQAHLPDNDPVWKPNPGGETLFASNGKPTAGSAVRFASKTDVIDVNVGGRKLEPGKSLSNTAAADVNLPNKSLEAGANASAPAPLPEAERASLEPPSISSQPEDSSALKGVLEASVSVPELSAPISQGTSGGRILHQVRPIYSTKAQSMRLEGKVVVQAMVKEDGTIGDVKVLEGHPELVQAVVDAVKNWRYQPFLLDGRPTQRETKITINFRLQPTSH
jgi:TonB family protein